MLQQKITVQVTTLPDCDDITRFDGTYLAHILKKLIFYFSPQVTYL